LKNNIFWWPKRIRDWQWSQLPWFGVFRTRQLYQYLRMHYATKIF